MDGKIVKTQAQGSAVRHRVLLSVTKHEVKTELKGDKVQDAERVSAKINGERTEKLTVVKEFEILTEIIPRKVMLGLFTFPVRE